MKALIISVLDKARHVTGINRKLVKVHDRKDKLAYDKPGSKIMTV